MRFSFRIFLYSLHEFAEEILARFKTIMSTLKTKLAARLLKLRVDKIEVKVRLVDEDGVVQNLRLVASSMDGARL